MNNEEKDMAEWKDVTDCFSERERHYNGTYLEQSQVYDEQVEISVFSAEDKPYEIYFSYGRFYGIVYTDAAHAWELRDEMRGELEKEYNKTKEPSDEYINWFARKYKVELPMDIFFSGNPFEF